MKKHFNSYQKTVLLLIKNDQINGNSNKDEDENDNMITRTFILFLLPFHCEDLSIKSALNHI